jgi:hypothetical protein
MMNEEAEWSLKTEEFERHLASQPLRQAPSAWRGEILTACRAASPRLSTEPRKHSVPDFRPVLWWRELFWPNPQAWAGLAAIWIAILAVNFVTRDKLPVSTAKAATPSKEMILALKQQQELFAELVGPRETPTADRPKVLLPGPRSERLDERLMA